MATEVLVPPDTAVGRIRALNDALRTSFLGGLIDVTPGFKALHPLRRKAVLEKVRGFDPFTHGSEAHDEGLVCAGEPGRGAWHFWRIDCWDRAMAGPSPDPADPELTRRVLTIGLPQEYAVYQKPETGSRKLETV